MTFQVDRRLPEELLMTGEDGQVVRDLYQNLRGYLSILPEPSEAPRSDIREVSAAPRVKCLSEAGPTPSALSLDRAAAGDARG